MRSTLHKTIPFFCISTSAKMAFGHLFPHPWYLSICPRCTTFFSLFFLFFHIFILFSFTVSSLIADRTTLTELGVFDNSLSVIKCHCPFAQAKRPSCLHVICLVNQIVFVKYCVGISVTQMHGRGLFWCEQCVDAMPRSHLLVEKTETKGFYCSF